MCATSAPGLNYYNIEDLCCTIMQHPRTRQLHVFLATLQLQYVRIDHPKCCSTKAQTLLSYRPKVAVEDHFSTPANQEAA